ncbi:MAG: polyprenol monophosphomannose synthase [Kiritimatiellae bacterium]|nr:polyprenol monophosphomannose synthase [Kiritimatiellia bacterium]
MHKPLVIIPTYNEKDNAGPISKAVLENLPGGEVLFVDDNSPDGTGAICDALAAADPRVHVLHREVKDGLGRAYIAGFQWALERDYDRIFEMDADFSHDPRELPSFIAASEDADLVLGSRYIGGIRVMNWPLGRLLTSTFAGVYVRAITGMPVMDPTGGFKCFRREVLEAIDLSGITSSGYSFQVEMTHNAWMKGFRIVEIPITFADRLKGKSKMSKAIAVEAFFKVWKLAASNWFRRKPRGKRNH